LDSTHVGRFHQILCTIDKISIKITNTLLFLEPTVLLDLLISFAVLRTGGPLFRVGVLRAGQAGSIFF